jgi:hypothetical protein
LHARLTSSQSLGLESVLRVYFAGFRVFSDFVSSEIERSNIAGGLAPLQRAQTAAFERLIAEVSEEYRREELRRVRSPEEKKRQEISDLLVGGRSEVPGIQYDLAGQHVAILATADDAVARIGQLAEELDARHLVVAADEDTAWAWIGRRRGFDLHRLVTRLTLLWPASVPVAVGEPALDLAGWRLTHRQAKAAFPVARSRGGMVRYGDVAVLASLSCDELLITSLRDMFIVPVSAGRDGAALQETLRAYFAFGRNRSSAAAALGVTRQTIANRLQTVEVRLGRTIESCAAQLEAALQLEELVPFA